MTVERRFTSDSSYNNESPFVSIIYLSTGPELVEFGTNSS